MQTRLNEGVFGCLDIVHGCSLYDIRIWTMFLITSLNVIFVNASCSMFASKLNWNRFPLSLPSISSSDNSSGLSSTDQPRNSKFEYDLQISKFEKSSIVGMVNFTFELLYDSDVSLKISITLS